MPSLSIWLFPHPILSSLTPSIAPLPDLLSILCDSWRGNLTWASPSHPIIVTHSCSSAGTQSWRAADRFHCSTASSSMCLCADIPTPRHSNWLPYILDSFYMLLPKPGGKRNYWSHGWQSVFSLLRMGVGLRFMKIAGVRGKQLQQQDAVLCLCKKRNHTHQAEHFDFISSSPVGGHSGTGQLVETHMVMNTVFSFLFFFAFADASFLKNPLKLRSRKPCHH